jgi:hypothetical protein
MFENYAFVSEWLIYIIFSVVALGTVFFALIMMRQIALMNRVLQTPYAGLITFMGFVAFCVSVGVLVASLFFLVPIIFAFF